MVAQPNRKGVSVEEYLELDRRSPDKRYEYIDGEVYLRGCYFPIRNTRRSVTLTLENSGT